MTITAKVIKDSIAEAAPRITTLQLRFPRFILPQFLTHRVFSRNAASSRAIPTAKLIEEVENDLAVPIVWGKNQKGMQAGEEIKDWPKAYEEWKDAAARAIISARYFSELGIHKQLANRVLEPFMHVSVLCTATDWQGFFDQRLHHDAQPEIQELARVMKEAISDSTPTWLQRGQWHLPYVEGTGPEGLKISAARCARVSYNNFKESNEAEDLKLFETLAYSEPPHLSPLEHQCRVPFDLEVFNLSNIHGWIQFRNVYKELK